MACVLAPQCEARKLFPDIAGVTLGQGAVRPPSHYLCCGCHHLSFHEEAAGWQDGVERPDLPFVRLSPAFTPGDLPNPGIEPRSPTLQADSLPLLAGLSYQGITK